MKVNAIFERLVLKETKKLCPCSYVGRPRTLSDAKTFELIFHVLRSGMQWRELHCKVNYTTILRRMHTWHAMGVFQAAYKSRRRRVCQVEEALRIFEKARVLLNARTYLIVFNRRW